jgi:hypothetical protein
VCETNFDMEHGARVHERIRQRRDYSDLDRTSNGSSGPLENGKDKPANGMKRQARSDL